MTSLTTYLRHLFTEDTVLYECRNCGETVDEDRSRCPACGAEEIAEYQLQR